MAGAGAMTISLAIDTATSRTTVGIIEDGVLLFEKFHEGATDHGRALSELVAEALKVSGPPDVVVVGTGPGPFTGLRVGISFAHTFALARQIPVVGICSLDAISINQPEYTVAIDARRKEIYWARYKDGVRIDGPHVSKPAEVSDYIIDQYPGALKLVALSESQNISEPMYLRRPDAVPTAERT
ncbi:MAG: tRNA (adenosine(37)-N6)-threonylcarbamoyltransferase complex dimerization subunit type 1 TsaB [Actinobacteria bacterium]|nr:tRNA (adenosine(37)-N6)-threonylcarbamoyltransferase complex dimerization subunit type 1 TsaB [Actinomycetota bacterium]